MNWPLALDAHKEWLEAAFRRRSLKELRSRIADLRPSRPVPPLPILVTPGVGDSSQKGGLKRTASGLLVPDSDQFLTSGDSPFSLEALIAAEMNVKATEKSLKPPEIPIFLELKRRPTPLQEPRVSELPYTPLLQTEKSALLSAPPIVLVWTDPLFYDGRSKDLEDIAGWYRELQDELKMPVLVRGELFTHPYQLVETRLLGGEGALISPEPLSRNQLEDLVGEAQELGVCPLVYVTTPQSLSRALECGVTRLVVGNGALFDAETREAPRMGPLRGLVRDLPADVGVYALGGVTSLESLDKRAQAGASGAFVGRAYGAVREALLRRQERG